MATNPKFIVNADSAIRLPADQKVSCHERALLAKPTLHVLDPIETAGPGSITPYIRSCGLRIGKQFCCSILQGPQALGSRPEYIMTEISS